MTATSYHHQPTSSGRTEASVPARSLPPLHATDRRTDGERLGTCRHCGGDRWWDNRAAKRANQRPAASPDFTCVDCRKGQWDTDPPSGWSPIPTVHLPPVTTPGPTTAASRQCEAIKKNGERCGGAAMTGTTYCGPHAGITGTTRTCAGTTKAGKPCRAGVGPDDSYCPQHRR